MFAFPQTEEKFTRSDVGSMQYVILIVAGENSLFEKEISLGGASSVILVLSNLVLPKAPTTFCVPVFDRLELVFNSIERKALDLM